ncbi:MAG TPA: conjugal transfer protein TraD [Azospirillum sp.]|nr:conjugal transfer protein TraD [Azospirillum sp.]
MGSTLEERLKRLEQKKAALAQEEARLKEQARKERTRLLIELGGLVVKAGLDNLRTNELLGALLTLKEKAGEESTRKEWAKAGAAVFGAEPQGERLSVTFAGPIEKSLSDALRGKGLRFNRSMGLWLGVADTATIRELVAPAGGVVAVIDAPAVAESEKKLISATAASGDDDFL